MSFNSIKNIFFSISSRGVPQPDNREGNEFCLGVLNNFYQDGVKLHDISCHHVKHVVCEQ